jgi:hypothetical protein
VEVVWFVLGLVLGAILGAVLGAWYTVIHKRPKLRVVGGGGGGGPGPGYYSNHVTVRNQPGLLGVRFGETAIFGKRLHKPIEHGFSFDRDPAKDCRAMIFDKETGDLISELCWRREGELSPWQRRVTIPSGESYYLALFARLDGEPTRYFVFAR